MPLPHVALRSAHWASLSPFAVKLLMELLGQYNGRNNGDLTVAWTLMSKRGWRSKASLFKAMNELESHGWIQRTRQGGRHVATLLAITIFALDDDNPAVKAKLGIATSDYRRGAWALGAIGPRCVPIGAVLGGPPVVPIAESLARVAYQTSASDEAIGPRDVPVNGVSQESLARHAYTSIDLPSTAAGVAPPSLPPRVRATSKTRARKHFGPKSA